VFVVGYLGDWRPAAAVLFERESMSGNPAPSREAGKSSAPTISARTKGGGGLGTDFDLDGGLIPQCSPALKQRDFKGPSSDGDGDGDGDGAPLIPVCFDETQITSKTNRCNPEPGDPSHPLAKGARPPTIAFSIQERAQCENLDAGPGGCGIQENLAYTLEARNKVQSVGAAMAVRRLTPRECERLQGFPDDYTLVPFRKKPAADGPRYKALGNSWAVPCARWIAERIAHVQALLRAR
jgi:DNA (cytosine-5)-methyltransferase 1